MNSASESRLVARSERGILQHRAWQYGKSEQGYGLRLYGPMTGPADILLIAAMHGDETETTVVLSEALREVPCEQIRNPVILNCNPDGGVQGTRSNGRGVDLNRNWPTSNWSSDPVYYNNQEGTARDIALSPGECPASESETRSLLACIEKLQPRTIISLHSPLACIEDPQELPLSAWIAERTGLPLVADVGYPTPGSFGTWAAENQIHIITWELAAVSLAESLRTCKPTLVKLINGDYRTGLSE
jgi:protein MpaA